MGDLPRVSGRRHDEDPLYGSDPLWEAIHAAGTSHAALQQ